jgi:hypothetical protein
MASHYLVYHLTQHFQVQIPIFGLFLPGKAEFICFSGVCAEYYKRLSVTGERRLHAVCSTGLPEGA